RIAPGGAHAVTRRAAIPGLTRLSDDLLDIHQPGRGQTGRMMRGLAAIAAILGAAAGLDVEELAQLDAVGIEMLPMDRLRVEQEIVERLPVQRPGRLTRPRRRCCRRAHQSRLATYLKHSILRNSDGSRIVSSHDREAEASAARRNFWKIDRRSKHRFTARRRSYHYVAR